MGYHRLPKIIIFWIWCPVEIIYGPVEIIYGGGGGGGGLLFTFQNLNYNKIWFINMRNLKWILYIFPFV